MLYEAQRYVASWNQRLWLSPGCGDRFGFERLCKILGETYEGNCDERCVLGEYFVVFIMHAFPCFFFLGCHCNAKY
jgi:hypothetical protein